MQAQLPPPPVAGPRKAVVLLSGGLDSATCLALATHWGWELHALSFDYGQRHRIELAAARTLGRRFGVAAHHVVSLQDLGALGGSSLTDTRVDIPRNALGKVAIPSTYVPARNTVFLSFAVGVAEVSEATEILIGANALDYSGYPDCRPEFLKAFEVAARLGTRSGAEGKELSIRAPLLSFTKAEIVTLSLALSLDPAWTTSCYDPGPDGTACGSCDSCLLRRKGFAEAGRSDSDAKCLG